MAAAVRQVDVEQDDVGIELADQRHGLGDGAGLADDLDRLAELRSNARAEDVVVVDEDDAAAAHDRLSSRSSTSVPSAEDTIAAVPPTRSMRPRIESAIPCESGDSSSGSNPVPRSRT